MPRVNGPVGMCLVMLAILGGMVFMAAGYPPEARLLPLVIGVPAVVMTLVQLGVELRKSVRPPTAGGEAAADGRVRREAAMALYLGGLVGALLLVGFLIAAPLFVAAFLRFREHEGWPVVAGAAAATLAVLFVVFDVLLGLSLYQGIIVETLAG